MLFYSPQHGTLKVWRVVDQRLAISNDAESFSTHLQTTIRNGVGLSPGIDFLMSLFGQKFPLFLRQVYIGFLLELDGDEECGLGVSIELDGKGRHNAEHIGIVLLSQFLISKNSWNIL